MSKDIQKISDVQTMTSIQIAELTGKEHKNIIRDIRSLLSQGVNRLNFEPSEYKDNMGRNQPCYLLTKKGCLILASGYDALLREKIINRWEELELNARNGGFQIPQTFSEALMLAADQAKKIEHLQLESRKKDSLIADQKWGIKMQQKAIDRQKQVIKEKDDAIAEMSPKVCYLDKILDSRQTVTTTQIALDYGMSAKKFNQMLKELKIQHKVGGQWILYAPYHTRGYVHSETFVPEGSHGKVVMNTKWTQKGRLFLYEELKKKQCLPLIERNN